MLPYSGTHNHNYSTFLSLYVFLPEREDKDRLWRMFFTSSVHLGRLPSALHQNIHYIQRCTKADGAPQRMINNAHNRSGIPTSLWCWRDSTLASRKRELEVPIYSTQRRERSAHERRLHQLPKDRASNAPTPLFVHQHHRAAATVPNKPAGLRSSSGVYSMQSSARHSKLSKAGVGPPLCGCPCRVSSTA